MNDTTEQAIIDSIAHWERLRAGNRVETPYTEDCPLCQEFIGNNCAHCPVALWVGWRGCKGTPWNIAAHDWAVWVNGNSPAAFATFREAASKEIGFLHRVHQYYVDNTKEDWWS